MTTHDRREVLPDETPARQAGSRAVEQGLGNASAARLFAADSPNVVHNGLTAAGNGAVARLMRHARPGDVTQAPADVTDRLGAESGHEIPGSARSDLEAGLGVPLGDVRLHTGSAAADMAAQVNAHAFTVGQDIYFGHGEYDPTSDDGYRLLAHEVTHTVQQSAAPQLSSLSVSSPQDHAEREASAIADHLTQHRGSAAPVAVTPAPTVVARHDSFEHTLLGDTPPAVLSGASGSGPAVTVEARKHLLTELWERTAFFAQNPGGDPRSQFPNVRWVQFKTSELWASNGELNALADYLADPAAADTMTRDELIPVLQKMRSGTMHNTGNPYGLNLQITPGSGYPAAAITDRADTEGMATSWLEYLSEAGGEVKALDNATEGQGLNRYAGLLSRNACHFAPFSWRRWEEYINSALTHAQQHHASRQQCIPLNSFPKTTEEHARQAILNAGYADHFLEDSFAAGHLVNKTLVMQWWVDYVNQEATNIPFTDYQIVRRGAPDADVRARMGSAQQRNMAGQSLYNQYPTEGLTDELDREVGSGPTDPQSTQERRDRYQREGGSGVTGVDEADREANYQAYLRLLNNAQAQGAAGSVHDYFNARGVTVVSSDGSQTMTVGGDDTMLAKSDTLASWNAATATSMSRRMIEETLDTGASTVTIKDIFALVPTSVVVGGTPMPLEQWQDQVLHDLCFSTIFPDYYSTLKSAVIGAFGSEMLDGGVSRDTGRAAPPAPAIGDFPMPTNHMG